jgi:hypothetical protein
VIGIPAYHSVGQIEAVESESPVFSTVKHSAPIRGGDSGGPLVTEDGELAGIHFEYLRYRNSDARRLDRQIEGNDCFDNEASNMD